jgi:hypothetical protein
MINRAEMSICNKNLRQAYNYYGKALKVAGNKIASKNLYNYFIVSADLREWETCKNLLLMIRKRDWKFDWYKGSVNKNFDKVTAAKLLDIYTSLGNVKIEIDTGYVKLIDSLTDIDQRSNHYFRNQNNGLLSQEGMDSLAKLNKEQLVFLKSIFLKKIPTDEVVSMGSPTYGLVYLVLMIHNIQLGRYHGLDSFFYQEVREGNFPPEEFDFWESQWPSEHREDTVIKLNTCSLRLPLFPYQFILFHDSLYQSPPDLKAILRCEQNRNLVPGLCSVEELRTKIIYQYYHPKYFLVPPDYIISIDFELPGIRKRYQYIKKI